MIKGTKGSSNCYLFKLYIIYCSQSKSCILYTHINCIQQENISSHLISWMDATTSQRVVWPLLLQAAISRNTSTYSSTVTQSAAFFAPSH